MFIIVIAVCLIFAAACLIAEVMHAPVAWEDQDGFHLGMQREPGTFIARDITAPPIGQSTGACAVRLVPSDAITFIKFS